MSVNWDELEEKYQSNFKDYAPNGIYKVHLSEVDIHEVGQNGSVAQDFKFAEDNYAYPKATHWLSFKNDGWRAWHNRCLMELLGASKDDAKKAVDLCESKDGKEAIVKAYAATYKRLAAKNPEVEIEVWKDGKYSTADFTSGSVRMSRPEEEGEKDSVDNILEASEEVEESDIPF